MENLIFGEWLDLGNGLSAKLILQEVRGRDGLSLITLSFSDDVYPYRNLLVKERKVFDGRGKSLDFGTAYPIATEYGKRSITKAFIRAWM